VDTPRFGVGGESPDAFGTHSGILFKKIVSLGMNSTD
jgi:hypothetical protein